MGAASRSKGAGGEREIAALLSALTGHEVKRRVRQHEGDSDIEGVPGWSVEVKRRAAATPGLIAAWWAQAVAQAGDKLPVLFYRADRRDWRSVWPLAVLLVHHPADAWRGVEWTADTTIEAWAAVARELGSEA